MATLRNNRPIYKTENQKLKLRVAETSFRTGYSSRFN